MQHEDDIEEALRKRGNLIPEDFDRLKSPADRERIVDRNTHPRLSDASLAEEEQTVEKEFDDYDRPPNHREQLAERGFKLAAFGLLMWPVFFFAIGELLEAAFTKEDLRPEYRKKLVRGWLLCLPAFAIILTIILAVVLVVFGVEMDRPAIQ